MESGTSAPTDRGAYTGWLVGLLLVVATFAIGAAVWFKFHP